MAPRWACHPPFCRTCPTPATGCRGGDALASSRPRAIGRTSSRGTDPTGPAGCTGNPKAGPPGPAGESGPPIPDDTPNPGRYNPHRSDRFSSTDFMRSAVTLPASPESFGRTPHKILFVMQHGAITTRSGPPWYLWPLVPVVFVATLPLMLPLAILALWSIPLTFVYPDRHRHLYDVQGTVGHECVIGLRSAAVRELGHASRPVLEQPQRHNGPTFNGRAGADDALRSQGPLRRASPVQCWVMQHAAGVA